MCALWKNANFLSGIISPTRRSGGQKTAANAMRTMNTIWDYLRSKWHTGGIILQKKPRDAAKRSPARAVWRDAGLLLITAISAGKTMLCLQEALSHFAKWCKNALCRKIPHPKAYRIRSAVLCFLMCFFHAGRKDFTVLTISGFNKAFLLPHSDFTQQLSRNAAEHP